MSENKKSSLKSVALTVQQYKNTQKKVKNETPEKGWKMKTPEKGEKWKHPRKAKHGNTQERWNMKRPRKVKNETPEKGEKWNTWERWKMKTSEKGET